ncbi:MAG: hypothetical protein HY747_08050 [Elusimicrobia bacterium]|nr:hypothetical protein [Elusimicrobiota bacterium]
MTEIIQFSTMKASMPSLLETLETERGRQVAPAMFLAGLSAAFLFGGYEFIRSSSESIFMEHFGAAYKPYALSCVPFVLALLIYLYSRALSAWGAARAMAGSMLSSALMLAACYFLLGRFGKPAAFFLFVFKESYVMIISEQYWSFVNSVLKDEEGRIFNGPVAGLAAVGSFTSGLAIGKFAGALGTESFILLSALYFLPAMAFAWLAYAKAGEPKPGAAEAGGRLGHLRLSLIRDNRTVFFIALVIFATQVVATALDLRFSLLVQEVFPQKDLRTAYLGGFWMKVNALSFSMQFLLAPVLLRSLPLRSVLVGIPALHIISCGLLLLKPQIAFASTAFLLFKGLDYSIFRASKETLYIPLSYDIRYRAKQIADAFTYRFSKGLTSLVFSLLKAAGAMPAAAYTGTALIFSAVWLGLSFPLTDPEGKVE